MRFLIFIWFIFSLQAQEFSSFYSVFSPTKKGMSYHEKLIETLDGAKKSLDICLYRLDSEAIFLALQRAVQRGVTVRMLYQGAAEDRKKEKGTLSHALENLGIDVKYLNKINHHKFVIVDGEKLVSSSGNWTFNANWVQSENAIFLEDKKLLPHYQNEFALLWKNSREFGKTFVYPLFPDYFLAADSNLQAIFTSANYKITQSAKHGATFTKISNSQKVADELVKLIKNAKYSVKMAANHLRSFPISEALIAKKKENPDFLIQVLTDQQNYITPSYHQNQLDARAKCLAAATTAAKKRDCLEKNFVYSYALILAGIELRFKIYAYSWDVQTAQMLHDKFLIFDDEIVATGSYNYSANSETGSLENVLIFNDKASPQTVTAFVQEFDQLWNLGRIENYYADLLQYIRSSSRYVPLLFIPMSLEHSEYAQLKAEIEKQTPAVLHTYFKKNSHLYSHYLKGIQLSYAQGNQVISQLKDQLTGAFTIDYTYNNEQMLLSNRFSSKDSVFYEKKYVYDSTHQLIQAQSPLTNLTLGYQERQLDFLDAGDGKHFWEETKLLDGSAQVIYHAPERPKHLTVVWDKNALPVLFSDVLGRQITWLYNQKAELIGQKTADQNSHFSYEKNRFTARSSLGEEWILEVIDGEKFKIQTFGTLASTTHYRFEKQADQSQKLQIDLISDKIVSGAYRTAQINYHFDTYGRAIAANDLKIQRRPYVGDILKIEQGDLQELRSYNAWDLLSSQTLIFKNQAIAKFEYFYDGMQRLSQVNETIQGQKLTLIYRYNARGELAEVHKNGQLAEAYRYDNFGNRTQLSLDKIDYQYHHSPRHQTQKYSWKEGNTPKSKTFQYNAAGQLEQTQHLSGTAITSTKNFSYNVLGQLEKVSWASKNLAFVYDAHDRPIALSYNNLPERKWIYDDQNRILAQLNENDRIEGSYVYADSHTPIGVRKGQTDYYLFADIRGSVRLAIKIADGTTAQRLDYDAFGQVLQDSKPQFTPFAYAGGLYEARLGLLHFGVRDYLPELGKWTSEDPIGFLSGSFNDYAYVANDPINYVDPTGLFPCSNSDFPSGKVFLKQSDLRAALGGRVGDKMHLHHIVEQTQKQFSIYQINNTNNAILIPREIHTQISAFYTRIQRNSKNISIRDWLRTKDFDFQFRFGCRVLARFGIEVNSGSSGGSTKNCLECEENNE